MTIKEVNIPFRRSGAICGIRIFYQNNSTKCNGLWIVRVARKNDLSITTTTNISVSRVISVSTNQINAIVKSMGILFTYGITNFLSRFNLLTISPKISCNTSNWERRDQILRGVM